jgi:hypothetical protein
MFPDGKIPLDDDVIFGASIGADHFIGDSGWSFAWVVRFLQFEAEPDLDPAEFDLDEWDALEVDPLMIQFGAAKKW